ncbi:MAG: carboxylesterase family protein [bacterium]|nr:carboxylesterase family protein [bacterium]
MLRRTLESLWMVGWLLLCWVGCVDSPTRVGGESVVDVTVAVSQGVLIGKVEQGVRHFRGIPFAAPPIGARRFRSPLPPSAWSGDRDAGTFAPRCAQLEIASGRRGSMGAEDCLYLNVALPDRTSVARPVLVWIHGGGRRVGDGRRDVAEFVRETDTLVVSIQYRLDHLAFLAHPALTAEDPARLASGNYGFEDAIQALRWVRDEVSVFGGDPQNVTIAGLSGGGTMVCGLLVAPEAAGLFHRAIIQSGGGCWFPTEPIELGEERGARAANELGCTDPATATRCLRSRSVDAFFRIAPTVDNPFPALSVQWFGAQPILGGRSGHLVDGHVFPRSWPHAFLSGAFHRVPIMISVTEHEGRRVYGELMYRMGARPIEAEQYPLALTGLLGSEALAERAALRFPVGDSPSESFSDVATEAHYTCPHAELAAATAAHTPTWLYRFRVDGPRKSDRIELGAYHGADTELLFGRERGALKPEQERAAERLRRYVGRFMRNGDPNGGTDVIWPRQDSTSRAQHLDFGDTPRVAEGLEASACAFLREVGWVELPVR